MGTIQKATITADIFREFYDLINGNVSDPLGRTRWMYSAFPDFDIDDPSMYATDYPLIVVNSPEYTEEPFTLKRGSYDFTIDIELFTTSAQQADEKTDEIRQALETGKVSFADSGLQRIKLDSKDKDEIFRGDIKIHHVTLAISGFFYFDKTVGF